jgi:hypothetical protein
MPTHKCRKRSAARNCSAFVIRISSFLRISTRLELWRALSFSDRAGDGNVVQLAAVDGAAKKQTAAAHIAATDEIAREAKSLAEVLEKNVDVFRRGNAAEEDDLRVRR